MDMFSGAAGSPCKATVFADKQPVGTEHWISWKTSHEVTVRSVAVFAAHDEIRLRRSFSDFKFYVKKQGQWVEATGNLVRILIPAYIYGGSCGAKPCAPAPAKKYAPGNRAGCVHRSSAYHWTGVSRRFRAERQLGRTQLRSARAATRRIQPAQLQEIAAAALNSLVFPAPTPHRHNV